MRSRQFSIRLSTGGLREATGKCIDASIPFVGRRYGGQACHSNVRDVTGDKRQRWCFASVGRLP